MSFTDVIYRTEREKYGAILEEIREVHATGRPILVGTTSIEKSEELSEMLKRHGIAPPGAQRQVPRARGRDRRAGGPQGRR